MTSQILFQIVYPFYYFEVCPSNILQPNIRKVWRHLWRPFLIWNKKYTKWHIYTVFWDWSPPIYHKMCPKRSINNFFRKQTNWGFKLFQDQQILVKKSIQFFCIFFIHINLSFSKILNETPLQFVGKGNYVTPLVYRGIFCSWNLVTHLKQCFRVGQIW